MPTSKESIAAGAQVVGAGRGPEPIELVAWDPAWVPRFEGMRSRLVHVLGETALRIDHVGSTAIDGMPAKPVIDIQISVPDVDGIEAFRVPIESQGFELRLVEKGHRYFRPPSSLPRLYQVHVCTIGSHWERVHLLFRDYLRTHSQVAYEYAAMKLRLANKHTNDRIAYNDEKGPFIDATVAAAEEWAAASGWNP